MTSYTLALLPGDGIGRDVMDEAKKILHSVETLSPLSLTLNEIPCGGKHYLETGEEWPEGSFEFCRDEADAILLGAIGWPGATTEDGDLAGGSVILGLRSGLDLYANMRPIKLYEGVRHKIHGEFTQVWKPGQVDMVVIRENTQGLYHALLRRSADKAQGRTPWEPEDMQFPGLEGEVAWDPRPISRAGSERVIRFAFDVAQRRSGAPGDGATRVTCVDKSNVTRGCQLFNRVYHEISEEYSETETDHAYIDAFCMWPYGIQNGMMWSSPQTCLVILAQIWQVCCRVEWALLQVQIWGINTGCLNPYMVRLPSMLDKIQPIRWQ